LTAGEVQLSEDNEHTKTLVQVREALVRRRRAVAASLLKDPDRFEEFVGVQNAINSLEGAIKQERSRAAKP
jgi:hypothetical protein